MPAVLPADLRSAARFGDYRLGGGPHATGDRMLAHREMIMEGNDSAGAVRADRSNPAAIWNTKRTKKFAAHNAPDPMAGAIEASNSQDLAGPRSRAEVVPLFDGFEGVEPGGRMPPRWRPERLGDVGSYAQRSVACPGVGHKP